MSNLQTNSRVETWTLSMIDRVAKNQPLEDSLVDLKAEWPHDKSRAAWQLGGLANAAGGLDILWIVGLDEKGGVIGASQQELASWWPEVQSQFDGVSPTLATDLVVSYASGPPVMALLFKTDRAPYVVKNPDGGRFDRAAPWREATGTHSATREQLMRILQPQVLLPVLEIRYATLNLYANSQTAGDTWWSRLDATVYVVPRDLGAVTFPAHHGSARARLEERELLGDLALLSFKAVPGTNNDGLVVLGKQQVTATGPGLFRFLARKELAKFDHQHPTPVQISLSLRPAGLDRGVGLSFEREDGFPALPMNSLASWVFKAP